MSKKLGLATAAALSIVVFLSTFPGCARTLTCENFVEKNRKCTEEIADYLKNRETANVFSGPRFQETCEPVLKEDSSDASKMRDCFKMVDCSDYVKCMMEIKDVSQNLL